MRHRLAHLQVLEVLAVEIELQRRDIVRVAGALGLEAQCRNLLQALQIGQRNRRAIADIGRAVLEGDRARAGIGQELADHAVDVGLGRAPIVGVALVDDVAAAHPFLELIGAGADRRVAVLIGQRIGAFIDVARHHRRLRRRQRLDQVGRRLGQLDDRGQRIGRLDLDDVGERVAAARMDGLDELDRIGDVGRGEGLAVVELHVRPQLERIGLAVGADRPFGRELRPRVDVVVVFQQALGHLGADRQRRRRHRGQRHQRLRLAVLHEGERAALLGHGGRG